MNSVTEIQQNSKKSLALPQFGLWHKKFLLAFVDLCILTCSLFYYQKFGVDNLLFYDFLEANSLNLLFGIVVFWVLTIVFNFYDLDYVNKTRKVLPLSFFIGVIFSFTYFLATSISANIVIDNKKLLFFTIGFTIVLMFWRVFYASVIHSNVFAKNCILLTSEKTDKILIDQIISSIEGIEFEHGLKILRTYAVSKQQKQIDRLSRAIERMTTKKLMDIVIIMDKDQATISNSLNTTLVKAIGNGVQVKTYFKLYEEVKEAIPLQFAGNQFYSILPISKYNHNYFYLLWHNLVDIIASILGLSMMMLLSPIILFLNIFFNKGPLFYKQRRVGKGGKEIEIIKFRSMIVEAEKHGAKMSVKGDLRVTSFGKVPEKFEDRRITAILVSTKGRNEFYRAQDQKGKYLLTNLSITFLFTIQDIL